jgi:type VI secretion system secreted protein VgrG
MEWSQKDRPFRLETPLGEDVLLLVDWEGEERISSFFRFTVRAFSVKGDINAKDLLLKPVTLKLRIEDGTDRKIHGVVSRLTRGGTAPVGFVAYELEIVPPHWILSLDEGFDIAQNKSARDLCDDLLKGTPHEWKLTGTLEPRPYIFRYRESRWNCVARLLEQEGIFFRYDHKGEDAKLVLGDSTASAQAAWGVAQLKYNEVTDTVPRLTTVRVDAKPYVSESRVRTASEFLATSNVGNATPAVGSYKAPGDVKAYYFEQQMTGHRSGITHSGGASASDAGKLPGDTKAYSKLRQEHAEAMAVVYTGECRYTGLEAGAKTEIVDHPNPAMNGPLFVIAVSHSGSNGSYFASDNTEKARYSNRFEAIPASTPFRPDRITPWPQVGGSHVGTVVGPAGEEIYTDKHGRVQVVFKWDLEDAKTLERSCWIRVAQSFAGQNFGAVWLPRIGHEVIVEFLDGNPDNPVVVGSLYNSANLPPWTLPDNKTQSGVKTKSTLKGGADNFNQMRFEDKKGEEHINVQAEKDLITLVKNDETRDVGHDRTTTIKNDETKTVKEGNETTTIEKGWQKITVKDNDRTLLVEKEHTITVNGNEQTTVAKDRTVTVKQNQVTKITQDHTVGIDGKQTRTIKQDDKTTVSMGNSALEVKLGNIDVKADLGNITIKAGVGKITLEALQGIDIKCGGASISMTPMGITIKAPMVTVEGQIQTQVKGLMVQVDAQAMLMAKGAITMIG